MNEIKAQNEAAPGDRASGVDGRVLWGLFALSLGIRLFFLAVSDNEDGDSFARVQLSRAVVDEGQWVPTEIWLPIQFWILSVPYALGLQSQFWARLLTALAGAGTVPVACLLLNRVFNRHAALAAALLLALNPLHIRFSVVTVSEQFLVFFLVTGLWGLAEWVVQGRYRYLVVGALAMNLACGNRTEAWLVVGAILGGALLKRRPAWKWETPGASGRAFFFGVLSSVFACAWMIFSLVRHGDPLHIATLNTGRVEADPVYQGSVGWYTLAFWPAVLLASLGPLGFLTSVQGAVRAAMRGPGRYLSILFFGFLGIYYVQNFRSGMITDARYALVLQVLLILSAGQAMETWGGRERLPRWAGIAAGWLVVVSVLGMLPLGIVSAKMQSISPCPRIRTEIRQVNAWLRDQPTPPVIGLGPGLGRYGPWFSLLDDWYPEKRVIVIKTEESFLRALRENPSGYVVFGKAMSSQAALWVQDLPSVTLRQVHAGADFDAYGW